MDYDNGFTGSTLALGGDTLPIAVVNHAPVGTPPGNKGFMVQVTAGVVTFWVWEASTSTWRSK